MKEFVIKEHIFNLRDFGEFLLALRNLKYVVKAQRE